MTNKLGAPFRVVAVLADGKRHSIAELGTSCHIVGVDRCIRKLRSKEYGNLNIIREGDFYKIAADDLVNKKDIIKQLKCGTKPETIALIDRKRSLTLSVGELVLLLAKLEDSPQLTAIEVVRLWESLRSKLVRIICTKLPTSLRDPYDLFIGVEL